MTRRWFVVACCMLVSATAISAQSPGAKAKADPLSGTWTGEMIPGNGGRISITMELKFDGKSAVSGTFSGLPNPGDVKSGTFDPKTGALKLQLGKKGEDAVLIVFDGTVAKSTASGHFTGEVTGEFKISKKA
jgi:hypothetical protein